MCYDPPSGVLVFGLDATVQHVDPAAADVLDADREALLCGTAASLQAPVSVPDGTSHASLPAFVDQVFAGDGSSRSVVMDGGRRATARVPNS